MRPVLNHGMLDARFNDIANTTASHMSPSIFDSAEHAPL